MAAKPQPVQDRSVASSRTVESSDSGFAFVLYLIFVVSWFLHLGDRIPILGLIRLDMVLVAGLAIACVQKAASEPSNWGVSVKYITALVVFSIVTLPFVEWPGSVLGHGLLAFMKATVFYFFTVQLVTTRRRLMLLLTVFVASQAFRVAEPLYLHVTTGYWGDKASLGTNGEFMDRLQGAPTDIINANGLAFVILTVIPFCYYLCPLIRGGILLQMALLPMLLYALVLTASRSGMLGLGMIFVAVWLKSKRKILLIVIMTVAVTASIPYLSADMKDRYLSTVSSDTKNAKTSQGRLQGNIADFQVALRRPLFGHGLGTSVEAMSHFGNAYQPSHNLYTEILQEIGFCGLGIFLAYQWVLGRGVRETFRLSKNSDPFIRAVAESVQVWFWMNMLFSMASYGLSSYMWYFMGGLTDTARRLIPPEEDATRPVEAAPQPPTDWTHPALKGISVRR